MKKYQWYNPELKKKANQYDWIMYGFAAVAIITRLLWDKINGWLLLLFLIGAGVFFILSWRVKSQDTKLKATAKAKMAESRKNGLSV